MSPADEPLAHDDTGGAGPALLLFHAFPLDRRMWAAQRDALAGDARVVCLDTPGFGASAAVPAPLRMETLATFGRELLDHLGVERAVVGGLSMGGYAALAFARLFPGRLSGLLLDDTRAGADSDEARRNREAGAATARRAGAAAVFEPLLPKLLAPRTQAARPEIAEHVRDLAGTATAEGVAAALLGMAERSDSTVHLAAITVPTAIVCGSEDALTPAAESESMHRAIKNSRLHLLDGAGHLSNLEQPSAFTEAVRELLREVRGTA